MAILLGTLGKVRNRARSKRSAVCCPPPRLQKTRNRLSTIRRADQILVVEAGRIVERGTHESLYALGGRYWDLYTRQHGLEANLFLAPGEGDSIPEAEKNGGAKPDGAGVGEAMRLIRGG